MPALAEGRPALDGSAGSLIPTNPHVDHARPATKLPCLLVAMARWLWPVECSSNVSFIHMNGSLPSNRAGWNGKSSPTPGASSPFLMTRRFASQTSDAM